MMTRGDLARLSEIDGPAYLRYQNRRLALLDRMLEANPNEAELEIRALVNGQDYAADFRDRTAREAIASLEALGVDKPKATWRLAAVQTRIWLLAIASPLKRNVPDTAAWIRSTWIGPDWIEPESPLGEWLLWVHVTRLAEGIRTARIARKFGSPQLTAADIEEARLTAEIPNDRWIAIRDRAAWVFRK